MFEAVSNGSVFPCVPAPYKFRVSDIPAALPESGLDYVSQDDTAALAAAGSMCCRRAAGWSWFLGLLLRLHLGLSTGREMLIELNPQRWKSAACKWGCIPQHVQGQGWPDTTRTKRIGSFLWHWELLLPSITWHQLSHSEEKCESVFSLGSYWLALISAEEEVFEQQCKASGSINLISEGVR